MDGGTSFFTFVSKDRNWPVDEHLGEAMDNLSFSIDNLALSLNCTLKN